MAAEDDRFRGQTQLGAQRAAAQRGRKHLRVDAVGNDGDLLRAGVEQSGGRARHTDDAPDHGGRGQTPVKSMQRSGQTGVAHVPQHRHAGGQPQRGADEVRRRAVAVDEGVRFADQRPPQPPERPAHAGDIARRPPRAQRRRRLEVVARHRPPPGLDDVLHPAGREPQFVRGTRGFQEIGDLSRPRQDHRTVDPARIQEPQQGLKAAARTTVASGVVQEQYIPVQGGHARRRKFHPVPPRVRDQEVSTTFVEMFTRATQLSRKPLNLRCCQ